ncbi:MAG: methyltransferase domain-containing protein [Phycisphaerales bacterium]
MRTSWISHSIIGVICASALGMTEPHALEPLHADAEALRDVYRTESAQRMLDEVERLPIIEARTIHVATRPNRGYTQSKFDSLTVAQREGLQPFEVDAMRYYSTFYGTPLVYARVLELVDRHAPQFEIDNARVMDLGYGQLGQLRLWAQMGADVVGVEVDPILTAMYDGCEAVGNIEDAGSVTLIEGAWPNDEDCRRQVAGGYDLIISRNLLKKGYVKPAQRNPSFPVPVAWGMSDEVAVGHFFDALAPGGIVVIESLGPKPDPAKPWSDIANPWPRSAWSAAGFEVLAHDTDESPFVRRQGRALGWDERMDLKNGLYGVYSVYRKPVERKPAE